MYWLFKCIQVRIELIWVLGISNISWVIHKKIMTIVDWYNYYVETSWKLLYLKIQWKSWRCCTRWIIVSKQDKIQSRKITSWRWLTWKWFKEFGWRKFRWNTQSSSRNQYRQRVHRLFRFSLCCKHFCERFYFKVEKLDIWLLIILDKVAKGSTVNCDQWWTSSITLNDQGLIIQKTLQI